MANTYTWDTKTVDVYPEHDGENDVVYYVHWVLKATSSEKHEVDGIQVPYTASTYGAQTISVDDITDFIPFDDLTEAVVRGWTENAIGAEGVESLKDSLSNNITQQLNPTSETKTIS